VYRCLLACGGRTGDQSASGRNGSPAESHRLQTLPVSADHRHRGIRIRIRRRPQLDAAPAFHRRGDQQLRQPVLHRIPSLRGRPTAGHRVVGVPQLQAQPLPIRVGVERGLTRFLHGLPQTNDQWVRSIDAKHARRSGIAAGAVVGCAAP